MLNIARTEKAVSEGEFFDLMYVNPSSGDFDASRQYVFIRKYKNEVLVVAVNFADTEANVRINIPQHAFDYLKLPTGIMHATDLMTGATSTVCLSTDCQMSLAIKPNSGKIMKIVKKK